MTEIILRDESYALQGAVFEVYRHMRPGFPEAVYQECLEAELADRGIPFKVMLPLPIRFKNRPLRARFVVDLLCFDCMIVELKAVRQLADEHRAQVIGYLCATGLKLGVLVNSGHHPKVQIERLVR